MVKYKKHTFWSLIKLNLNVLNEMINLTLSDYLSHFRGSQQMFYSVIYCCHITVNII